jgi:hypothetical protein
MAEIIVVRGIVRTLHKLAEDDSQYTLVKLRDELQSRELMSENDLFIHGATNSKIAAGKSSEATYSVVDVFKVEEKSVLGEKPADPPKTVKVPTREVGIAPGEASIKIVVGRGRKVQVAEKWSYLFSEKWSYQVKKTDTLAAMRLRLKSDKRMQDHEMFLADQEPVPRSQEEHTAIEDAIQKENDTNILLISSQRWG